MIMSNFDKCVTIWFILIGCVLSSLVTQKIIASDIKAFNDSYRCAPITKHIDLESAKKQVEINQARVAAATRD